MKWEDFLNRDISNDNNGQMLTDIECPKCGRRIYYDSTIILTTYPDKYVYWCSCGWKGFAHDWWVPELDAETQNVCTDTDSGGGGE